MEVDRKEAEQLVVTMEDFNFALEHDIKPAFGSISDDELHQYIKHGSYSSIALISSSSSYSSSSSSSSSS